MDSRNNFRRRKPYALKNSFCVSVLSFAIFRKIAIASHFGILF